MSNSLFYCGDVINVWNAQHQSRVLTRRLLSVWAYVASTYRKSSLQRESMQHHCIIIVIILINTPINVTLMHYNKM